MSEAKNARTDCVSGILDVVFLPCTIGCGMLSCAPASAATAAGSSTATLSGTSTDAKAQPVSPDAGYAHTVLADHPIAYWRFNETSGTSIQDHTGKGHDGTLHGGVTLGQPGIVADGLAASFDGETGYIEVTDSIWGGGREVTIEAWVNVSQTSGDFEAIVSAVGLEFVHLQLHTGGNISVYTDTGYSLLPIVAQTPLDVWRHIALVASPSLVCLYVDGVEVGSSTTAFATIHSTTTLRIGNGYGGERFFHGRIDEVAIYDYALSIERIQAHIAASKANTASV
ncbi:LamG domain-containing protein [Candidatus Entotheonella palauensis]|uniref:LamG-like jellyroll fold domain-containing protein n=1 Tax=Candidatus Entotheonella gemina TaxID=1429439 RepID=W4M2N1_9BACT|nr:LamG domain-containing protein [Candidatus Entotheonella palauensis]ETX04450.1 MAG: hypothetical protein ETSY2_28725 [Candidatus Entotheonella gemina]